MTKDKLIIGLGQINPTVGDIAGNTKKILSCIKQAEAKGVDLLVFPELAISGYPIWDLANKKTFVEKGLEALAKITQKTRGLNVAVAVGFVDIRKAGGGKNFDSMAVIRNGKIIHKQHKALLPTYDVFLEGIFFEPGNDFATFKINDIPIGATICEDIWDDQYAVKPAHVLAKNGAKIILNLSASPYHRKVPLVRNDLICRKAKDYGVWIVYANQVGGQDDLIFDGRSVICNPAGKIVYQAESFCEGLYVVTLELDRKSKSQVAYEQFNEIGEMYEALKLGLQDYVRKNGFKKVVLGLSGGIDSALVAVIAADALGPEDVIGVTMPGPFSSKGSWADSEILARNLGVEFRVKPIKQQYTKFVEETIKEKKKRGTSASEDRTISLAMENLQARLRGMQLMYLSNDEGALLLTTGNKSELAMGYGTLYGDMCGGLSVICDVFKVDVSRLADYRNSVSSVIPKTIINKAPSAELRPNQKDSDSLPEYDILDAILHLYIEKNVGFEEICEELKSKGIPAETVRRVVSKVDFNEYKRRQLAPALRVSEKAWFGRRMPITNCFRL